MQLFSNDFLDFLFTIAIVLALVFAVSTTYRLVVNYLAKKNTRGPK
jgi:preprotein translocase subunit SecY